MRMAASIFLVKDDGAGLTLQAELLSYLAYGAFEGFGGDPFMRRRVQGQ